ncbi:hypothetical protein OIO90_004866 [Microbotryomycetes sp. JL221]|nr:hypothetical protein OIO90_004866 [Microbotryomycetes sp. JL221]
MVEQLCQNLIPQHHPDWATAPSQTRQAFSRMAESVSTSLAELEDLIEDEQDDATQDVATGASATSLRNTVQPASESMGSDKTSLDRERALQDSFRRDVAGAAVTKSTAKNALKRAFGVGKLKKKPGLDAASFLEPSSTSRATNASSSPPRLSRLTLTDDERPMSVDMPSSAPRQRGAQIQRRRAMTAHTNPSRSGTLPMPGEGDDDDSIDTGISYRGSPRFDTYAELPPTRVQPTSPPQNYINHSGSSLPSAPSVLSTWSDPDQLQRQHTSQHSAVWPINVPATAWPDTTSSSLHRAPSRLTRAHQSQQGYTPAAVLGNGRLPSMQRGQSLPASHFSALAVSQPPPQQHTYAHAASIQPPHSARPALPIPPTVPNPNSFVLPSPGMETPTTQWSSHTLPHPMPPPSTAESWQPATAELTRKSSSIASLPPALARSTSSPRASNLLSGTNQPFDECLGQTESGQPLRNVIVPSDLVPSFVGLASDNTKRGIETCGLLMGTLSRNTFTISHLLIPQQEGTPDTCTTTHEEEQFQFQDERDLMTLGWIHTHPTQSCFMSSLDLHTHASYQVMLAEAIAIVCAPNHEPSVGIFRMTDPPGLETIVKCDVQGLFHPHPDLPIYTDVDPSYGHCRIKNIPFESVDLRSN